MTGPRDMKPWEVRLYTAYRNNLHTIKPTTKQGRNIHRLERALIVWPAHFYARWVQRKSRYRQKTTQTVETPEGVFFNAESETT